MSEEKLYYDALSVAKRTSQRIHLVENHDKNALIALLLQKLAPQKTIIITKTKKEANTLKGHLLSEDFKVTAVHGNTKEEERVKAFQNFTDSETDIIITTDKIFQDQEVTQMNLIISYALPLEKEDYFARLSALNEQGESITLISEDDQAMMSQIEHFMGVEILVEDVDGFEHTEVEQQVVSKKKKPRHKKSKS